MAVRVVVPISGGKDSQACLKLALLNYPPEEVRGLFCDTQFEHPLTYAHVEKLRTLYGQVQIDTVTGGSVDEKVLKYGRFPGGGARHCTDELKLRVTRDWLRELAKVERGGIEVWYGVRSAESSERETRYAGKVGSETYPLHEYMPRKYPKYLHAMGVVSRLAILEWSTADVFSFLGDEANPLYAEGFERVGCFPCLAAGDAYKEKAFSFDGFGIQQHMRVIQMSSAIGKSVWTSKGGLSRNESGVGCSVCQE